MTRLRFGLGLISAVCVASAVSGCGAQQQILGHPVTRRVAIVVRISDEVNAADQAGGVAELVQTIADGLKDQGMESEIYTAADDHPPPPRIELNVVYWSETSQTSRGLRSASIVVAPLGIAGAVVGPSNRMIVDCGVVLDASEQPVLQQRFQADKSLASTDEASAGGNAGSRILTRIFKR